MNDDKKPDLKFSYNNIIQTDDIKPLKKIKTFVENNTKNEEYNNSPCSSPKKNVFKKINLEKSKTQFITQLQVTPSKTTKHDEYFHKRW